jgi:hypothetical protein
MSYATYAESPKGYSQYAHPESNYTNVKKPGVSTLTAEDKEGTFTELLVTDGVGDYHINHFIGYGSFLQQSKPEQLVAKKNQEFYRTFAELFSQNVASAETGDYSFKGHATIEFEIGGKFGNWLQKVGGFFHSDWVSMQMADDGESFYGSTLRRKWMFGLEEAAVFLSEDWRNPIEVNQHHFLAGRRSFKIGYSKELSRLYIETAAFERSSLCEYNIAEKSGLLRSAIVQIWTNLIKNVEASSGSWISPLKLADQKVRQGYNLKGNVDYRVEQYKKPGEALEQQWFDKVIQRNPGLLKGLSL